MAGWPDVAATMHWRFDQPNRADRVDFSVGADELDHIHLDGSMHSAAAWARGWTVASIDQLGADGSGTLFRRNDDRLRPPNE